MKRLVHWVMQKKAGLAIKLAGFADLRCLLAKGVQTDYVE